MNLSLKTSLLALFCLASLAGCGDDHRTEDFCNIVCECSSANANDQADCSANCSAFIQGAEDANGVSPISDECFACINNSSCQIAETSCNNACSSLQDAFDEPQPDPQPGDSI